MSVPTPFQPARPLHEKAAENLRSVRDARSIHQMSGSKCPTTYQWNIAHFLSRTTSSAFRGAEELRQTRKGEMPRRSGCSTWFAEVQGGPAPAGKELGAGPAPRSPSYSIVGVRRRCPLCFWCCEPCARPDGSIGLGSVFGPPVGDRRLIPLAGPRRIPFGRLTPLPTPPPNALRPGRPLTPRLASAVREADSPLRIAVRSARRLPRWLPTCTPPATRWHLHRVHFP